MKHLSINRYKGGGQHKNEKKTLTAEKIILTQVAIIIFRSFLHTTKSL